MAFENWVVTPGTSRDGENYFALFLNDKWVNNFSTVEAAREHARRNSTNPVIESEGHPFKGKKIHVITDDLAKKKAIEDKVIQCGGTVVSLIDADRDTKNTIIVLERIDVDTRNFYKSQGIVHILTFANFDYLVNINLNPHLSTFNLDENAPQYTVEKEIPDAYGDW